MKHLTDSNLTLTAQEAIVLHRKAHAVYNLCREFCLPSLVRTPIRGMYEELGNLCDEFSYGCPDAIANAVNEAQRHYARALIRIQDQEDPDDLEWLTLLLNKIEA